MRNYIYMRVLFGFKLIRNLQNKQKIKQVFRV